MPTMIKYERALLEAGRTIQAELARKGHRDLPFVDADITAREARLTRLETGISSDTPRLHPSLEGRVQLEPVIFSGLSKKNLYEMVSQKVVDIDAYTREIVESSDILPSPESSHITLVDGKVGDLVPNPKGRL